LIRALLARGTRVYVPKIERRVMGWVPIASLEELRTGHFGVPEPEASPEGDPPSAAPVVVPGLAFTPAGYRLGYGGGYFDRFLAVHRGPSVGVAFECQVTAQLPVEPHDVPVKYLVTEERSRVCPRK
jgi:5-formyltetrahydrofolate cyclo-ligase